MSTAHDNDRRRSEDDSNRILHAVSHLQKAPDIHHSRDPNEPDTVELDNERISLDVVRTIFLENEEKLAELSLAGIPLDWLEFPHGRTQRRDLPPDYAEVDHVHERLREQAHTRVESIMYRFAEATGFSPSGAKKQEWTELVLRMLGGVAYSIRAAMPRVLRRQGHAYFLVEQTPKGIQGRWEDGGADINLESLVREEAEFGELDVEKCELFSQLVCNGLLQGENIIPSFQITEKQQNAVRLIWRRSSIPSEMRR
jgi:hypothetical protein